MIDNVYAGHQQAIFIFGGGVHVRSRIIGWRPNGAPIYLLGGSSEMSLFIGGDDDSDDIGQSDDDDDDGGDGDTSTQDLLSDQDGWKPPTADEWHRLQETAKRATRQAVERKRLLREHGIPLKQGREPAAKADGANDRESLLAEAREQARAETVQTTALVRLAALEKLRDAGWNGKGKPTIGRLLDIDRLDVEVDGNGNVIVDGLDEQIEEIKAEIPEWFRRKRVKDEASTTERTGAASVDGQRRVKAPESSAGWRRTVGDQLGGLRGARR